MILLPKDNKIDLLGEYKVGVPLTDPLKRKNYYVIYDLKKL